MVEEHRAALLAAGNDPLRIIAANYRFWSRKYGYLQLHQPLSEAYLFNHNTQGSYHPWSARVMGEAFGNDGLKEVISIKDYLDLPVMVDEFLEGVAEGTKRALNRKAAAAPKTHPKGYDKLLGELSALLKEGQ